MIFSFFKFYYYVLKKSSKKYDIAMSPKKHAVTAITPLLFMLLYSIIIGALLSNIYMLTMYLWIPLFLFNLMFLRKVADEGYSIRREENRKKREAERLEREYERWEQRRKWEEEYRRNKEQERRWRERLEEDRRRHEHHYTEQFSQQQTDRNMLNAMSLLGLKEGFTKKEARSAYRRLAKTHHPDAGGLEENFKRLSKAYKYVMDRT